MRVGSVWRSARQDQGNSAAGTKIDHERADFATSRKFWLPPGILSGALAFHSLTPSAQRVASNPKHAVNHLT
jgi:hypothetical protein